MTLNWYPIIDYEKCTNCLSCVEFCKNGVIVEEEKIPKVVKPENCIEFCKGCQKVCDYDAINFFSDKKGGKK
jgi:NAD-dependent dihydropyrimidine dehydrogenase PreA subunit